MFVRIFSRALTYTAIRFFILYLIVQISMRFGKQIFNFIYYLFIISMYYFLHVPTESLIDKLEIIVWSCDCCLHRSLLFTVFLQFSTV